MNFNEYMERHRGKRVTVLGVGVSNLPLIRLLARFGAELTARDKKPESELGGAGEELRSLGARLVTGAGYLDGIEADILYRTPGIRPDLPEIARAVEAGALLTSEMEAFLEVCPCRIIAVTGSDGKTTTSTLLAEMLRAAGRTVHLGGNIGTPLLDRTPDIRPDDVAVLELSSFQLMTMRKSADIAVVTNVTPNHLDMHSSMDEYVDAKRNVFRWQGTIGRLVLNYDNDITRSFGGEAKGTRVFFSSREQINGVCLRDGAVIVKNGPEHRVILKTEAIRIPGMHNVENYMAAIAALDGLVPDAVFEQVARSFNGVEHRIEFIRELDGARYYNDSIASSPTRTVAGLRSFKQKVILIAGGYDKKIPFQPLAAELGAHVKKLILLGATRDKIRAAAEAAGYGEIALCPSLEEAVAHAREAAEPGDVVLFSPACASFDLFKNFEARGQAFKELVNRLVPSDPGYVIRPAREDELELLADVIRRGFATVAEEFGLTVQNCPRHGAFMTAGRLIEEREKGVEMYCLCAGAVPAGFAALERLDTGDCVLEKLTVLPEYRHRGYGAALLNLTKRRAAELGSKKLLISVIEENEPLKKWYASHGFIHTGAKKFDHLPFTSGYMEYALS